MRLVALLAALLVPGITDARSVIVTGLPPAPSIEDWQNAEQKSGAPPEPRCAMLDTNGYLARYWDGVRLADGSIVCPEHKEPVR